MQKLHGKFTIVVILATNNLALNICVIVFRFFCHASRDLLLCCLQHRDKRYHLILPSNLPKWKYSNAVIVSKALFHRGFADSLNS